VSGRLLRKSGEFLLLLWAAGSLTFLLLRLTPGDPALAILQRPHSQDVRRLQQALQLERPLAAQYIQFLGRLVVFDLGRSLVDGKSVGKAILASLPNTLLLALAALALSVPTALLLGFQSAMGRSKFWVLLALGFSAVGLAVPVFLLGLFLVLVFSVGLGLLPVSGSGSLSCLVLPALTLALPLGAALTRVVQAALRAEAQRPYVILARAKGLSDPQVYRRHILKNALLPVVTLIGMQAGALLSGAIVVESVFSWPGIGTLLVAAIRRRDYPMVQGSVLLVASLYLLASLLVDLAYPWLDPRIGHARRR
jgi:peptide/nickel transport system permease protein